jgi:hypothetical protein
MVRPDPLTTVAGATLGAIGVLHVAWGRGSTWPYADLDTLADVVVGRPAVPPPAACYAVAGLLGAAAVLVGTPPGPAPRLHALGQAGVATVLGTRATLGFLGRTDLVSPGSASPAFRRNDRRRLSPLCAALAFASGRAAHRTLRGRRGRVRG